MHDDGIVRCHLGKTVRISINKPGDVLSINCVLFCSWRNSSRRTTSCTNRPKMAIKRMSERTPPMVSRPSSTSTHLTFKRSLCHSASKFRPLYISVSFPIAHFSVSLFLENIGMIYMITYVKQKKLHCLCLGCLGFFIL